MCFVELLAISLGLLVLKAPPEDGTFVDIRSIDAQIRGMPMAQRVDGGVADSRANRQCCGGSETCRVCLLWAR